MTNSNETAPDRSEGQAEIEPSETQNHDESAPQDVEALSTGEGVLDSLADAQAEAEKFRDLALRSEAEMQNLRKRAERDVQNAHKFGVERLIQNLLPVLDSLEKAIETSLQAETPEDDPQLEGLKLCFKLFIGQESGYELLGDCSLVTSPYQVSGECVGVLGVIGPTRMAYDRIIPIVDATARMLTAAMDISER